MLRANRLVMQALSFPGGQGERLSRVLTQVFIHCCHLREEYDHFGPNDPAQQPRGLSELHIRETNHAPAFCWPGKGALLPAPPPLGTVRDTHASYGSGIPVRLSQDAAVPSGPRAVVDLVVTVLVE